MTKEAPYLLTKDLSVGYQTKGGTNLLLEKLSLALTPGRLVCFMGPNGIGKSTLIRTLAGLQKPLRGNVSFSQNTEKTSELISLVLTDRITTPNMTVYDLVTFGRYPFINWMITLSNLDKEKIDQAIRTTNIQHLIHKRIFELSDGQIQLAMIARTLAQDTPIILLDEPTAHLDLNNRVEIMNLLRDQARTAGKAILVSTHELDLALQTADFIWLADMNKNIRTGIPEDLVLNGSFDEVFQFKGFDLKSGKIHQEAHLGISVKLVGEGHEYLWTKNALERNGFQISESHGIEIQIKLESNKLIWNCMNTTHDSLNSLINFLQITNQAKP